MTYLSHPSRAHVLFLALERVHSPGPHSKSRHSHRSTRLAVHPSIKAAYFFSRCGSPTSVLFSSLSPFFPSLLHFLPPSNSFLPTHLSPSTHTNHDVRASPIPNPGHPVQLASQPTTIITKGTYHLASLILRNRNTQED